MPDVERVIENVDISTLDQGHIANHTESIFPRGIWFPRGFSEIR